MPSIKLDKAWQKMPKVAKLVHAAFPGYRKHTIYIWYNGTVTLTDINWSGGCRSEYYAMTLDGELTGGSQKYSQMAPWNNPAEGMELPIPEGFVVVEGGQSGRETATVKIHINPLDISKLLLPELLPAEGLLLN